ncbi:MAG: DUF3391 domain-containing protein [Nitrospira sp. BO4]|jgi:HD-GYP domain-containing protein (c-di-GMP phosphodiesterase class II)|nr:DUF3391 domain-containing protein [Nitrospira sp. BO4]
MAKIRVSIFELQIGMYVAGLDLPWFRSPFLRHSFLVEDASQITKLMRAGVKTVDVDPDRGVASPPLSSSNTPPSVSAITDSTILKRTKALAQLNEEYAQAKQAKQQLDQAVQSVFATIAKTGTVNPQQAAEAVQEITIVMRTLTDSAIFMALSQNRSGDSTLSRHALATCTLSLVIGQAFQFNPLELQELAIAALLHDIGLLQVRPTIVRRVHSTSNLCQADREEFETHPRLAVLTLQRQGGVEPAVLDLIANHHTDFTDSRDPSEAPRQLSPDRTRILMIADQYDELITGFGGASPLSPHQAFQRLYQAAQEGRLDQRFLSSFIARVGIYPVHSYVQLNTRELAVVTELNQQKLHQPIITITHQSEGIKYPAPFVVDLSCQPGESQPRVIETIITMDT